MTRLEKLLFQAGVESSKRSTIMSLRMEVARLREATPAPEPRPRAAPRRSRNPEETIASLRAEHARLKTEVRAAKDQAGTVKHLEHQLDNHRFRLRGCHDEIEGLKARHGDEVDWLKKDIAWLRETVGRAADKRNAEIASLRTQFDRRYAAAVRKVGARDRTIAWLHERNHGLRAATARATELVASLRGKTPGCAPRCGLWRPRRRRCRRASRRCKSSSRSSGRPGRCCRGRCSGESERQKKPRSGRKRGQQRGAPGHGRTRRPRPKERAEKRNPPKDARVCPRCGKPYVANGELCTALVEIEVKAHKHTVVRPRWLRACECASSPKEVTAPPMARLFDNTAYGISVWVCVLFERFVSCRPLHRVATWLADMGLAIAPGTLADSIKRFVPLFEPLAKAILAHQNKATLRHADETTWRIQALRDKGRSNRAWLWTSVSRDAVYYHIDPSRSAEVAKTLFASIEGIVVLVSDRLSTCKRLARELDGKVILQWCWAHQRRSFIDCAAGRVRLSRWCEGWIERIAEIYRLNDARLVHYDPGRERQTPEFDAAQGALKKAVDSLFVDAETELAGLSDRALRAKPLRSLVNHREGLSVFVDRPHVPPDNNRAEFALRSAVIGRRLSFGSDSERGAKLTAMMYSVAGTLAINGIDVRRWLEEWLTACAKNGGKPPDDLSPWLPWCR